MNTEDNINIEMTNKNFICTKIIINGRIRLSELDHGQALGISGDNIVFVGSNEDAIKYINFKTSVTDVSGKNISMKLQENGKITISIDNQVFSSNLFLSPKINSLSSKNSRVEYEMFEFQDASNHDSMEIETEIIKNDQVNSCMGAYRSLPDFKCRPGYYFVSNSGSEFLHLYLWGLKDLAWYLQFFI